MQTPRVHEFLYQALETEQGGILVYRKALECAVQAELRAEWTEHLEQAQNHERILRAIFDTIGLDAELQTPGRTVVKHIDQSLIRAMELAQEAGDAQAAEAVACECVAQAETKDHRNWELIGQIAEVAKGDLAEALREAHEEVEGEENDHLYAATGELQRNGWA